MFCADLFNEIDFAGIEECFVFICVIFFADDDTSETGSSFSEEGDYGSGINP
jgi:hypothetical protein